MKKVQWDPKKIHATSPQKIGTGRLRTLEIKKIQYSGYGSWTVVFQQNSVGAVMSMEDTALKTVAPRMSCAVLAAAAW
jgi:hypothetical protein